MTKLESRFILTGIFSYAYGFFTVLMWIATRLPPEKAIPVFPVFFLTVILPIIVLIFILFCEATKDEKKL